MCIYTYLIEVRKRIRLKIMVNLDGSPKYVDTVEWFGVLTKNREELEAK